MASSGGGEAGHRRRLAVWRRAGFGRGVRTAPLSSAAEGGPMIEFSLNGRMMDVSTEHQLSAALDVADAELVFDLSVAVPDGSAMFMLRNASDAWLMHLREPGDAG